MSPAPPTRQSVFPPPGGGGAGLKTRFAGVLLLNALLAYPILFLVYKHFNPVLTPMDIYEYAAMVDKGPGAVEPPFRYRVLAPLAVRAMRPLPGYDIPVAFSQDPAARKDFFHFLVLDFALVILASALLFVHLQGKVRPGFAYLGSLLYLFSFYTVVTNVIPMADAACHAAIIGCILLFERDRPVWFALACLAGVFAKETLLLVLFPWIALQGAGRGDRRRLLYLLYALPAALAYFAATRLFPSASSFAYYEPGFLLGNLLNAFNPGRYDGSMVFHILLAHLPLLAALAAYAWLRFSRKAAAPPFGRELAVFFFLVWLGMTMDLGNNTGRVAFMAFPALILFEARMLEALASSRRPDGAA